MELLVIILQLLHLLYAIFILINDLSSILTEVIQFIGATFLN